MPFKRAKKYFVLLMQAHALISEVTYARVFFKRHMKTRSSRVNNAHETRLKHVEYRFKTFRLKRSLKLFI
jgi:hypothetical protein